MVKLRHTGTNWFSIILLSLIWMLIVFPSTFLASAKIFLMLCLFSMVTRKYFITGIQASLKNYICLLIFGIFLFVQIIRGVLFSDYDWNGPVRSASAILLVLAVSVSIYYALGSRIVSHKSVIKTIYSGCFMYVVLKLLLLLFSILGFLDPRSYVF